MLNFVSHLTKIQEICEISLIRQPVRIHKPLLWPRTNTAGTHKIVENPCGSTSPVKLTSNYISGRYVSVWEDRGGSTSELSKCDIYSAVSWHCDKSEEINIKYSSGNRIFGNDNKFQRNDLSMPKLKIENIEEMYLSLSGAQKQ